MLCGLTFEKIEKTVEIFAKMLYNGQKVENKHLI
jgi:hypothetical protein